MRAPATGSERTATELLSLVCDAVVTLYDSSGARLRLRLSCSETQLKGSVTSTSESLSATATGTVFKLLWPTVAQPNAYTCTCEMHMVLVLQCSSSTAAFAISVVRFRTWWASERTLTASARGRCQTLTSARMSTSRLGASLLWKIGLQAEVS